MKVGWEQAGLHVFQRTNNNSNWSQPCNVTEYRLLFEFFEGPKSPNETDEVFVENSSCWYPTFPGGMITRFFMHSRKNTVLAALPAMPPVLMAPTSSAQKCLSEAGINEVCQADVWVC